mgnify:CR=1 FL=1
MSTVATAPTRRTTVAATGVLLLITAVWGSTFFLIKDLLTRVPTLDFLAVRFGIAAVLLVVVAPKALARLSGKDVELRSELDPKVIGGVLVRAAGKSYDGTVRGRLRALRSRLVHGA